MSAQQTPTRALTPSALENICPRCGAWSKYKCVDQSTGAWMLSAVHAERVTSSRPEGDVVMAHLGPPCVHCGQQGAIGSHTPRGDDWEHDVHPFQTADAHAARCGGRSDDTRTDGRGR